MNKTPRPHKKQKFRCLQLYENPPPPTTTNSVSIPHQLLTTSPFQQNLIKISWLKPLLEVPAVVPLDSELVEETVVDVVADAAGLAVELRARRRNGSQLPSLGV